METQAHFNERTAALLNEDRAREDAINQQDLQNEARRLLKKAARRSGSLMRLGSVRVAFLLRAVTLRAFTPSHLVSQCFEIFQIFSKHFKAFRKN